MAAFAPSTILTELMLVTACGLLLAVTVGRVGQRADTSTSPRDSAQVAGDRLYATGWYASLVLLLLLVGTLVTYKTRGAIAVISAARGAGTVTSGRFLLSPPLSWHDVMFSSTKYLLAVWPALLFGVLISAAVRAFVSPEWLVRLLGRDSVRTHVAAGLAGVPLMLCSCCVAPIFHAAYDRSSRLGPAVALMLASPLLNPAALILTSSVFGGRLGLLRVVLGLALVFPVSMLLDRLKRSGPRALARIGADSRPTFLGSIIHVGVFTVPVILGGVVAAMAWLRWAPLSATHSIPIIAAFAVPLALPTFAEIPLAMALIGAGAPLGAAAALIVAGPAVNLPSLLSVGRSAGWKVALLLAVAVWVAAVAGGLLLDLL